MVGMRLRQVWGDRINLDDARANNVDITDADAVEQWMTASDAPVVLHLAAKTDVDGCEEDKIHGEEGEAWQINVRGTEHIVAAAQKTGKRVVYISTDFVFDGTKDVYTEQDATNPINWYGRTKEEGELVVLNGKIASTIVRIAYPYGARSTGKKDFVERIKERMQAGLPVNAVSDHWCTPTLIDDLGEGLALLLQKPYDGIYHLVGSQTVNTVELAQAIAKRWQLQATITPVTREEYFRGRAFRPRNLALKSDRITELGIEMRGFAEGLPTL